MLLMAEMMPWSQTPIFPQIQTLFLPGALWEMGEEKKGNRREEMSVFPSRGRPPQVNPPQTQTRPRGGHCADSWQQKPGKEKKPKIKQANKQSPPPSKQKTKQQNPSTKPYFFFSPENKSKRQIITSQSVTKNNTQHTTRIWVSGTGGLEEL